MKWLGYSAYTHNVKSSPEVERPTAKRRIYKIDPIVEALCQFTFSLPTEGWISVPFRLQEKLKSQFPSEPVGEGQPVFPPGGNFSQNQAGIQFVVGMGVPGRIRFKSADEKSVLLVSQGVISVGSLQPYSGWETFERQICDVLNAFSELSDGNFALERIGLRYINRVGAPIEDISEFFEVRPLSFGQLDLKPKQFISRSELGFADDPGKVLIATFAKGVDPSSENSVILDLDVVAQGLEGISTVQQVMSKVVELRAIEKSAFEAAITERSRQELFGGYVEEGNV